jgi:hypothetical protein
MSLHDGGPGSSHTQVTDELICDRFREPSPDAGRSTTGLVQYLLYRDGSFVIELRLDFDSDSQRYFLAGKIFSSQEEASVLKNVPVHLYCGRDELALTFTNRSGEFCLEYEAGEPVHICLSMSRQRRSVIPLDQCFWRISSAG